MWTKKTLCFNSVNYSGVKTLEEAKLLPAQQLVIRRNEPGECI